MRPRHVFSPLNLRPVHDLSPAQRQVTSDEERAQIMERLKGATDAELQAWNDEQIARLIEDSVA